MVEQDWTTEDIETIMRGAVMNAVRANRLGGMLYCPDGSERLVFETELETANPVARGMHIAEEIAKALATAFGGLKVTFVPNSCDSMRKAEYFFSAAVCGGGLLPMRVLIVDQPDRLVIEMGGQPRIEI